MFFFLSSFFVVNWSTLWLYIDIYIYTYIRTYRWWRAWVLNYFLLSYALFVLLLVLVKPNWHFCSVFHALSFIYYKYVCCVFLKKEGFILVWKIKIEFAFFGMKIFRQKRIFEAMFSLQVIVMVSSPEHFYFVFIPFCVLWILIDYLISEIPLIVYQ